MKRIVTIQDISCFGKCSLTVALPIISAMGVEAAVVPTAVLSTHTGCKFKNFTFRDLTSDIIPIMEHWENLGINFDGIYTGYLGSTEQIEIVSKFFGMFKEPGTKIIVDPVMGDAGKYYTGFDDNFAAGMKELCAKADIIVPNMTEASFLLGIPYTEDYDEAYAKDIITKLTGLGCRTAVLTGVHYDDKRQGAMSYDNVTGEFRSSFEENIPQSIHGTGDIFSSVLSGAAVLGADTQKMLDIAVKFTVDCIRATLPMQKEHYYGAAFELCLASLAAEVKNN